MRSSKVALMAALGVLSAASFAGPAATVSTRPPSPINAFDPLSGLSIRNSPNGRPRGANMAFIRRARKLRNKARAKR